MKTTPFAAFATVAAAASLFAASGTAQASPYAFELRNVSSLYIISFHATNVGSDDFGPDLLGSRVIRPGRTVMIDPDDGSGRCHYDLRTELEGGQVLNRWNVNLCAMTRYTIGR
jgi:hypothetical protein